MHRGASDAHACDPARRAEFEMLGLRAQILSFEEDFAEYLASVEGRFEVWLAARDVRRA